MIQVRDLKKAYGRVRALKGVSFSLQPGVTGLLGPNGAGKTTLLRCMLGIIRPTSGDVRLPDGSRGQHREVGYLPQRFGLLRELTVHEALAYFAALKEMPPDDVEAAIDEALREVNLLDRKSTQVGALSGGMIRRVGVAATLLGCPTVLVFDEPTAGLDPEERVRFKRLVASLSPARAVLISTHIVEDIVALASRVMVLDGGEVRASGTLEEVANLARGKCYFAPPGRVNEYSADYFIDGYAEVDGQSFAKVLSPRPYEGFTPRTPSVEDGYLCVTRGMV